VAKAIAVFTFLVLTVLAAILIERKVLGRMQMRPGPNRVGPRSRPSALTTGELRCRDFRQVPSGGRRRWE